MSICHSQLVAFNSNSKDKGSVPFPTTSVGEVLISLT